MFTLGFEKTAKKASDILARINKTVGISADKAAENISRLKNRAQLTKQFKATAAKEADEARKAADLKKATTPPKPMKEVEAPKPTEAAKPASPAPSGEEKKTFTGFNKAVAGTRKFVKKHPYAAAAGAATAGLAAGHMASKSDDERQ